MEIEGTVEFKTKFKFYHLSRYNIDAIDYRIDQLTEANEVLKQNQ
jgi:hypothetical protein